MIEHAIDDNAGDRYVQPDRQRPSGKAGMFDEVGFPGAKERHDDHGEDDDGKDRMGDENGEIERSDPALSGERHRANVVMVHQV